MKKLIAALLGSTAIFSFTPAHADTWSGFYGGVFLGYGWSTTDAGYLNDAGDLLGLGDPCDGYNSASGIGQIKALADVDGPPSPYYYCEYSSYSTNGNFSGLALPGQVDLGSFEADGEMIGVNAGINYQAGNWVFGIEGEAGILGLSESYENPGRAILAEAAGDVSAAGLLPIGSSLEIDGGMYMALFGKLGYAFGDTMIYGKAGYGAADLGITVNVVDGICGGPCWTGTTDDMTDAFMYGAGVEHRIGNGISLKLEYVRMEFDDTQVIVQNFADWDYYEFDTSVDTVKLGVNFRLGSPE